MLNQELTGDLEWPWLNPLLHIHQKRKLQGNQPKSKTKTAMYAAEKSKKGNQCCQCSMFGIPLKTSLVTSWGNGTAV